ncbi:hypothetical protein ABZ892_30155 [Streptomyces sp. NPDC046924]|uniref:hypothetical protein n=1 Tax=Streptomyces sp. NPDC046924 TaxID=3155136 RepID=UPI0033D001C5
MKADAGSADETGDADGDGRAAPVRKRGTARLTVGEPGRTAIRWAILGSNQ